LGPGVDAPFDVEVDVDVDVLELLGAKELFSASESFVLQPEMIVRPRTSVIAGTRNLEDAAAFVMRVTLSVPLEFCARAVPLSWLQRTKFTSISKSTH
jgi:hypothetical protein